MRSFASFLLIFSWPKQHLLLGSAYKNELSLLLLRTMNRKFKLLKKMPTFLFFGEKRQYYSMKMRHLRPFIPVDVGNSNCKESGSPHFGLLLLRYTKSPNTSKLSHFVDSFLVVSDSASSSSQVGTSSVTRRRRTMVPTSGSSCCRFGRLSPTKRLIPPSFPRIRRTSFVASLLLWASQNYFFSCIVLFRQVLCEWHSSPHPQQANGLGLLSASAVFASPC